MKKREKTIFVITQFYPPDYAPTGQLIQDLITSFNQTEHDIKVFTGQPSYAYKQPLSAPFEQKNGIYIRRTRSTKLWSSRIRGKSINGIFFCLRVLLYGLANIKKEDILVLTTAPPFLSIVGYFFSYLIGAPYFCIVYDLYPDVAVQLGIVSKKNWLVKLWDFSNRRIWNQAERIIVLSSSMKRQILKKHPQLAEKIHIIHNWADPNSIGEMDKSQNWFAIKHKLVDRFTVLYSGNMGRCHDMLTIMEAALHLKDKPIQFVFIGGGPGTKFCCDLVNKWNLQNCLFLPYQDKQDLPYSLTACDLSLVSIKKGMEGVVAPSKFYSAIASGRPIAAICQKNAYLSQIIDQAQCGASFENGDSLGLSKFIQKLEADPELAKKMGQSGRNHLKFNYTPEIIAQEYQKVLEL